MTKVYVDKPIFATIVFVLRLLWLCYDLWQFITASLSVKNVPITEEITLQKFNSLFTNKVLMSTDPKWTYHG